MDWDKIGEEEINNVGKEGPIGPAGKDGVGIDYNWKDTKLGIKKETENTFTYVDLKGDKGDKGEQGMPGENGSSKFIEVTDSRNIDDTPDDFFKNFGRKVSFDFKYVKTVNSPVGMTGNYVFIMTFTGWTDPSGGYPFQLAFGNDGLAYRTGKSREEWNNWIKI